MSDAYTGEIQIFGFNYAPYGWMQCNGATLLIQQYAPLYALIGITYGGDGKTNFKIPDFTGRAACSTLDAVPAQAANRTPCVIGKSFGTTQVTLTPGQMPSHTHAMTGYRQGTPTLKNAIPVTNNMVATPGLSNPFVPTITAETTFAKNTIGNTGSGLPHENRQPLLPLNFCICLNGEYPQFP